MRTLLSVFLFMSVLAAAQVEQSTVTPSGGAPTKEPSPQMTADGSQKTPPNNWGLLPPGTDPQNHLFLPFARHLVQDQKQFWSSPFHLQRGDAKYGLPFLAFTGALMASDSWISKQVPDSPSQLKRSRDFSNYAIIALVGTAGTSFVWGHIKGDDHASEAGLLAAEASINSTAVAYALKEITQRPRPFEQPGSARFFQGGGSFPSEHAAVAWSTASVLAHEYPGTFPKLLFYGLASGITVSRVTAKQHFASDAVVGSALGWYLGRQVYRAHHDPEVGGSGWGSSSPEPPSPAPEKGHVGENIGSAYVPLDSWIYPAMERLIAWGYVHDEMLGMRPWTREECARVLDEMDGVVGTDEQDEEAAHVYRSLQTEFSRELNRSDKNIEIRLDSLYTRVTGISGPPVNDSFNFGSTVINDDGRPYQEGANVYSGFSSTGTAGPLAFYFKAEYQHAPSAAAMPIGAQQAIADQLQVPFSAQGAIAEINRARILEGYVSLGIRGVQFSFGKQSLWWGPTETGPLIWSTNAEAIPMFRISNSKPYKLPSVLGWLGPMRNEFFLGQLDGQQYIQTGNGTIGPGFSPQPFIHGVKISFKLTPSMELGFSRTVVFSGEGHPFTVKSFWKSLTAFSTNRRNDTTSNDAGDRRIGFDFSYRVPGLRKYLTVYTDSFCEDDPSPLGNTPNRCAWSPGFYLAKLPKLVKLDFRAEGVTTAVSGFPGATGLNYTNFVYPNGYTNNGRIIGSWVGREGHGVQLSSTYWLAQQSKVQLGYRHQGVDPDFLKGGWLDDYSLHGDLMLRSDLVFSGTAQFERWNFPLLSSVTKSNSTVSLGFTYRPSWKWTRK